MTFLRQLDHHSKLCGGFAAPSRPVREAEQPARQPGMDWEAF